MVTPMQPFLDQLEHARIERAIAAAEQKTSGEIRVVMYPKKADNPVMVAASEFLALGMHRTTHRNAVLFLIAPFSNTFAVYGDEAVHAKCGQTFWTDVAAAMTDYFKRREFTDGIVHGIERAGALLATHFPRAADDRNELPDDVIDRGTVI